MCGRYTIRESALLRAIYGIDLPVPLDVTYNAAPSQSLPIIRHDVSANPAARLARWGLIPHWTKGKPRTQPINARSETAGRSPMFRQAMQRRRCLVPADGFYEWQGNKPPKQPFFIRMKDDAPFCFAGLWERWQPEDVADPVDTFTILTTDANDTVRPIHPRMPVILDPANYQRWLARTAEADQVADLLGPYPPDRMEAWPISTKVNSVRNNGPDLVDPAT